MSNKKENSNNRYREEELEEQSNEMTENIDKEEKDEEINTSQSSKDDNNKTEELENEIKRLKNEVLLLKADEINYRKRLEEDKFKSIKYANQVLLEKLIEQLDLFDKVVQMKTEDPVLKNFLMGFEMINNNFKQVLSEEGVKKIIVTKGDALDPKYHHALQTEWDETMEENVILEELKSGYTYKDRVLKPSLVKVNKKEVKTNE